MGFRECKDAIARIPYDDAMRKHLSRAEETARVMAIAGTMTAKDTRRYGYREVAFRYVTHAG